MHTFQHVCLMYIFFSVNVAKNDCFYLKPTGLGFCRIAVGVHTLEKFIPKVMKDAGFVGKFTLHSLRATCATRLYNSGVDEQMIQEITGHTSNAVRAYKRTSDEMRENVSHLVQCEEKEEEIPEEMGRLPCITFI